MVSSVLIFCYSNDLCMKCWLDIYCAGSNQEINKRSWWSKADFSWATATQDRWVIQRWNRTVPGSRDNPRTLPLSLQYNFMALTIYNVSTVTMCNIPAALWELHDWEEILDFAVFDRPLQEFNRTLAICIHTYGTSLYYTTVQCKRYIRANYQKW